MIWVVSFTTKGANLCRELTSVLSGEAAGYAVNRHASGDVRPVGESLSHWVKERFRQGEALVFIGAAGIAVRLTAPFLSGKERDPAVLCIDEEGQYVIPLAGGHMGGANALAHRLALLLGARAVITTATDINGLFAFDTWAAENGYAILEKEMIKHISAALLEGAPVGLQCDFPIEGPLPKGTCTGVVAQQGVAISVNPSNYFSHTLHLVPRCLIVGIGCKKGIPSNTLEAFFLELLKSNSLLPQAVGALASIDIKREERAILDLAEKYRIPFHTYSAAQLMKVEGVFASSPFVWSTVGADNVCERAAALAADKLLVPKITREGVTLAVGMRNWTVRFDGVESPGERRQRLFEDHSGGYRAGRSGRNDPKSESCN